MMKKKKSKINKKSLVYLCTIIVIVLALVFVFAYASGGLGNRKKADLNFDFEISDSEIKSIKVKANKTRGFDYTMSNDNDEKVKYAIAYSPSIDGVKVAKLNTSEADASGIIDVNETKKISVVVENNTNKDVTINIIAITNYEKEGELNIPDSYNLVSDEYEYKS